MSICSLCKLETEETEGCVGHAYKCGREKFAVILFGEEGDHWGRVTQCCKCFAQIGKPHHAGCIEERCPVCRKYLHCCGCVVQVVDVREPVKQEFPDAEAKPKVRKGRRKARPRLFCQVPSRVDWPLDDYDRQTHNGLLLVYNICGLGNRENEHYYIHALRSILEQTSRVDEVIVSGCMNRPEVKELLMKEFKPRGVSFNFIEQRFPVNVTFNHTVMKSVEKIGRFAGYVYVDSGIQFRKNTLEELRRRLDGNRYGMIAAEASNDNGYPWWFNSPTLPPGTGDFIMPVGKTLNLHTTVFTDELFEAYGRLIPDIFASYSTESVFSFQCAAIKKQFCVCRGVVVDHAHAMDGGAAGFRGPGFGTTDHVLMGPSLAQICADPEGTACGFGYEEFRQFKMHDPSQFDANQHCINDRLLPFLKKNIFLSKELLDYDAIHHEFVPRD